MAAVREIEQFLYTWAPRELAAGWDNVGLLVGDPDREVTRILVALDVTRAVADEAARLGAELIVAHHPVMNVRWHEQEMQTLRDDTRLGGLLTYLVRHDLSAICMHTDLDAAEGGVNEVLAGIFGMRDWEVFADGCGRVGEVEPITVPELARKAQAVLGGRCNRPRSGPAVQVKFADSGKTVKRLAVISGAGGSMFEDALAVGADCLLTGEANHHAAIDAVRLGLSLELGVEAPVLRSIARTAAAEDLIKLKSALEERLAESMPLTTQLGGCRGKEEKVESGFLI